MQSPLAAIRKWVTQFQWTTGTIWWSAAVAIGIAVFIISGFVYVPPPGYAIALLGAFAVVMSLREPTGGEKTLWILGTFMLMAIEMFAISHDRKAQDANFNHIVDGLTTTINISTGGEEFCFLVPIPPFAGAPQTPPGRWPLYVSNSGTVPLPFCDVRIISDNPSDATNARFTYLEAVGPNKRFPTQYSIVPGPPYRVNIQTPLRFFYENVTFSADPSAMSGYRVSWKVFDVKGTEVLDSEH
jgi:hypothetical protein